MNKLILIDGYGFVFRAFHSLPPLTRQSDGTPIGAVYGFTNMLLKLLENNKSSHIAVVLDNGEKTFRHAVYPEYKANRPTPPDELICQFPIIREVVDAFAIKAIEKPGFEADDLIASYAKYAKNAGYEVVVVSSDKDLMQLLEHGVLMYDAMKDKIITNEIVLEKFGVTPDKIRDVLALIGDASDNIPGVRGIGPKTAAELINTYGSLNEIYAHICEIKQEKRRQMLLEDKANAMLSYELVGMDFDAPLEYSLDDLKLDNFDALKLMEFTKAQGFKTLSAKLSATLPAKAENILFTKLPEAASLQKYFPEIYKCGQLALLLQGREFFISFLDYNFVLELTDETQGSLFGQKDGASKIIEVLKPILLSSAVNKATINSKWLFKINPEFYAVSDIAIMAYALETGRSSTSLEVLVEEFSDSYRKHDSHAVSLIYNKLKHALIQEHNIALYERVDKMMPKIIAQMENLGVRLDSSYLASLSGEFALKLSALEKKIFELAGGEFNIASPKQMGEILFEKLQLPGGKKSKAGAYGTSAHILEVLRDAGHHIADLILEWRSYAKLISTYTDALPKAVNKITGRIHSNFLFTETATGRLSSSEPNLQNIPIRTEEGNKIRSAFIASPGNKIISADYSQIELRLLAHYGDIKTLKDAFKAGQDVHAITASQMFGVPIDKVDSSMRRQAKTINFGIIYGISAFGLADRLDITKDRAKNYIEQYFTQYPGIKAYMDNTIQFAHKHGYVLSIFGRKCLIKGIGDRNFNVRSFAERAAINAPLQASSADIIKKAMVELPESVRKYMILQIHDELLFDVPEAEVEKAAKIIKQTMETAASLSVPLTAEVTFGNNWAEAH
ncbi:MAG: polA [Candidatus Midichloriaceae bacterium]|jgi:DNA polymerase-1|nr:polA [Candidatus Midichloriaceae bacterium]